MTGLNTLERDDLLRKIAWQNARIDKIERMLKGEQVGTARIADAAITNAKINDLTWDKAYGGTATLGGLDNVSGILSVRDGSGIEKVVIDKDGILINDGNITIKDENGTAFIDSEGLISDVVFPTDDINFSYPSPFTDDGSGGAVTLSSTPITFTLIRNANVLVLLSVVCSSEQINSSLDCNGRTTYNAVDNIDGSLCSFFYDSFLFVSTSVRENIISKTYSSSNVALLSAGSHSISVTGLVSGSTNMQSNLNGCNLSVTLLAK